MATTIIGEHDDATIAQLERCIAAEEGARGVLCADGHLGYSAPIGGVMAYRDHVSPSGAGFDLACGNKAARLPLRADELQPDLPRVMDAIVRRISFGVGRESGRKVDHPVLDEIERAEFTPQRKLATMARNQLGTVGGGNHYVDLFEDEDGFVWVGVHFGSRGFGHRTASGFLAMAEGLPFDARPPDGPMDSPPVLFRADSEIGTQYIAAAQLAGRYAYAGRDVVVDEVCRILGAQPNFEVHNHHNEFWRETHFGEDWWVVRKGATPAFPGQLGFVGASMGEPAVILEGVDSDFSKQALYSTVHGAGRAMSRREARGVIKKGRVVKPGKIDFAQVRKELRAKGIELRGGDADEAPGAYKRLDQVLRYHEGTVRILHTLDPIGVAMAGPDVVDPYKD